MSDETKRDVFDELLKMFRNSMALTHEETVILDNDGQDIFGGIERRYAAALPDDLPVIPQAVGEYIQWGKSYDIQLYMMYSFKFIHSQGFKKLTDYVESWIISSSNVFARAWLLGAWCVEETGEIVKLEEEK